MPYSKPVQMLVDEHEVILSALDAVEAVAGQRSSVFPADFYAQAADFFATFADRCHHAKEETLLFPRLQARGIPRQGGPIGVMLADHDAGRGHLAAVRAALPAARAGDQQAVETARQAFLNFAELLRDHIAKENQVLFMLADQVMTAQDKEELWDGFQTAERDALPAGIKEKYHALAATLRQTAGL